VLIRKSKGLCWSLKWLGWLSGRRATSLSLVTSINLQGVSRMAGKEVNSTAFFCAAEQAMLTLIFLKVLLIITIGVGYPSQSPLTAIVLPASSLMVTGKQSS